MQQPINEQMQALMDEAAPLWKEWPQIKGRPLPLITEEALEFWMRCKQHELVIQKCKQCGQLQFPPCRLCRNCMSLELEWVKTSGKGTIYTFTTAYNPPYQEMEVPYNLAIIDLDEGVRMATNLVNCKVEDIKIGLRVRVLFYKMTEEITLPFFEPDVG